MAGLKAEYDEAEQEYKQHKEQINTVAEGAESVKVNAVHFTVNKSYWWRKNQHFRCYNPT